MPYVICVTVGGRVRGPMDTMDFFILCDPEGFTEEVRLELELAV